MKRLCTILFFLCSFFVQAQKGALDGQGAISDIITSMPIRGEGNGTLNFESPVTADDPARYNTWYKFLFTKYCYFDIVVTPIDGMDKYDINLFRIENNMNYCEAHAGQRIHTINYSKIKDPSEKKNTKQESSVATKKIYTWNGDAIYLAVTHLRGPDKGFTVQLTACDYAYNFKVAKEPTDSAGPVIPIGTDNTRLGLARILKTLCNKSKKPSPISAMKMGPKNYEIRNRGVLQPDEIAAIKKDLDDALQETIKASQEATKKPTSKPAPPVADAQANATKKQDAPVASPVQSSSPLKTVGFEILNSKVNRSKAQVMSGIKSSKKTIPVRCLAVKNLKKEPVEDAKLVVKDNATGREVEVEKNSSNQFEFLVEKGKKYKVECTGTGVKKYNQVFDVSSKLSGEDNQLIIQLEKFVPESKMVPVRCIVINRAKGTIIPDVKPRILDEATGKTVAVKSLRNNELELLVEKGVVYKVEVNTLGYKPYDLSIDISNHLSSEDNQFVIELEPLKIGENFVLKNIYYHPNTPVIKSESNKELEALYKYMKNNPEVEIQINGHTNGNNYIWSDKSRSQLGGKWNFHGTSHKLSRSRASEVKDYLIKRGIVNKRIKSKGWGGDKPVVSEPQTIQESMMNMRVEVEILKD